VDLCQGIGRKEKAPFYRNRNVVMQVLLLSKVPIFPVTCRPIPLMVSSTLRSLGNHSSKKPFFNVAILPLNKTFPSLSVAFT
jgi:hypothetical protein